MVIKHSDGLPVKQKTPI